MKKVLLLIGLVFISFGFINKKKKPKATDELYTIKTRLGEIQLILFDDCPEHKANFTRLVKDGFYDGTTFHRVINNFMIQGGDPFSKDSIPDNDGRGGPGYTIPAEFSKKHKHVRGAFCAARQGNNVNPEKRSSGSQFYIVQGYQGAHQLDNEYTVYGQVIKGMTIVDIIANSPKNYRDRPLKDISMTVTVETLKKSKITDLTGYQYETSK